MTLTRPNSGASRGGIAMIIVMIMIIVLAVLAGGFAYSMKVETRLARNTSLDTDLEWLGRSGVELARYVLAQSATIEPVDMLRQKWAGGPGNTNDALADISLTDNQLGDGTYSIKIVDLERKANINTAPEALIQQALVMTGADPADFSTVTDSILDWVDRDNRARMTGAEDDYYLSLKPPYVAKNGPMGDISELLMVKGITPAIYWGPASNTFAGPRATTVSLGVNRQPGSSVGSVGMVDLFTALSSGRINPNTASQSVLELVMGGDAQAVSEVMRMRAGYDGVEGTDDDTPITSPAQLAVGGPGGAAILANLITPRSTTFEVRVDASLAGHRRKFMAILRRVSNRDVQILYMHWD